MILLFNAIQKSLSNSKLAMDFFVKRWHFLKVFSLDFCFIRWINWFYRSMILLFKVVQIKMPLSNSKLVIIFFTRGCQEVFSLNLIEVDFQTDSSKLFQIWRHCDPLCDLFSVPNILKIFSSVFPLWFEDLLYYPSMLVNLTWFTLSALKSRLYAISPTY